MEVYTDGSYRTDTGKAGYGVVIKYNDANETQQVIELFGVVEPGMQTNHHRAELYATIVAIQYIQTHLVFDGMVSGSINPHHIRSDTVEIYCDSQFIINGINGHSKVSKNLDLFNQLVSLNRPNYSWSKIPRCANKAANKLAKQASRRYV